MSLQAIPYPPHLCLAFRSMSLNVERRKLWDYQRLYWSSDRCHRAGFTCQPFQSPHHRRPPDCSEEHLCTEMVFNASEIKLNNMLCFPMWVQNWGNWTSTVGIHLYITIFLWWRCCLYPAEKFSQHYIKEMKLDLRPLIPCPLHRNHLALGSSRLKSLN